MTVQELGPTAADIHMLRTELDELLRARQYAAQRERRLAEAVQAASQPDRAHGYAQPHQQPDPELLRRLAQARSLREGLGTRCLDLSERLLALEDLARQNGGFPQRSYREPSGPGGTGGAGQQDAVPRQQTAGTRPSPFGAGPHTVGPHTTGDRSTGYPNTYSPQAGSLPPGPPFQGAAATTPTAPATPTAGAAAAPQYRPIPEPPAPPVPPTHTTARTPEPATKPAVGPAAMAAAEPKPAKRRRPTGARFGGAFVEEQEPEPVRATAAEQAAAEAAGMAPPSAPTVAPVRGARFGGVRGAASGDTEYRSAPADSEPPTPSTSTSAPTAPAAPVTPAPAPAPPPRSAEELAALAVRVGELHGRGSAHESAAVVAQAAVTLAPQDVARLAALLRSQGPYGAAGYLVRATAHGSPDQAAGTLAELRRVGLADEANELFHALWGVPGSALPALIAALERAGQAADGQTLLWEWASAPPAELAALTAGLAAAGRTGDVRHLLRQVAGRPIADVAATVEQLAFPDATAAPPGTGSVPHPAAPHPAAQQATAQQAATQRFAATLVRETAGLRSPGDLAELGRALLPHRELYQVLLGAAAALEESRSRGVLAALRSAGLPTAPPAPRPRGRR